MRLDALKTPSLDRVLVVGHSGGIGSALSAQLCAANMQVIGIDRRSSNLNEVQLQLKARLRGSKSIAKSMKWLDIAMAMADGMRLIGLSVWSKAKEQALASS